MSDVNHRPTPDALERGVESLRAAEVPAGPSADLTDATISLVQNRLAGMVPVEAARQHRRRRIMRYMRYGSVAAIAAGLLVAVGVLWVGGGSATAHFHRAMDNAAKAKTVRFTWLQTAGPPGQKGTISFTDKKGRVREHESSSETTMHILAKGTKVRFGPADEPSGRLEDYATDTGLLLDHKYKVATRFKLGGKDGDWFGLFDRLGKLKPENVKPLGEEMVGKVKAVKYELEKLEKSGVIGGDIWPGAKWTVWIDPKTDLPVRLRYMKDETLKWEFNDFVWNEPADDALFEQKVPKGYEVEEPE